MIAKQYAARNRKRYCYSSMHFVERLKRNKPLDHINPVMPQVVRNLQARLAVGQSLCAQPCVFILGVI